ncbi:MAG: glycosyltransferase [Elusimicrobiales bacterium]|nr:glycosyltransferase [Elusimicrobiales bacterium]
MPAESSELVSICIPVYNGIKYIRNAVESAELQTYKNIEIVVQDNASTDGTWEVLVEMAHNDPRLSIERNPENIGMAPNWNRVLSRAKGSFISVLNCDDSYAADFIESSISLLRKHGSDIVSSNHFNVVQGLKRPRRIFLRTGVYRDFPAVILLLNPFPVVFSVFTRELFARLSSSGKFFNENFNLTCDYELLMRMACSGVRLFYNAVPKAYYGVHDSNLSRQSRKMTRQALLVILRYGGVLQDKCNISLKFTLLRFVARIFLLFFRTNTFDGRALKCSMGRFIYGF